MRGIAYAVAALAAVGIMIVIATVPGPQPRGGDGSSDAPAMSVAASELSTEITAEPGAVTLSVPTMHCEFACFPKVKETLEGAAGVQHVELAEQEQEGVIDNRQVIVKFEAGFDLAGAIALLAQEGFAESEVVQ